MTEHPITRLRRERGWSRLTLAVEAGLHPSTVYSAEVGRFPMRKSTVVCLAHAFGMTRGELEELLRAST